MNNYEDIINLPHHESNKYSRMNMKNRAAQFSPFAALTGHSAAIKETSRLTDERIDIDDNLKDIINYKLQIVNNKIKDNPKVIITYFVADGKKSGGKYLTITDKIKKIDLYRQEVITISKIKIPIHDIIDIDNM